MNCKFLIKDIKKSWGTTSILFALIMISAFLVSSASITTVTLFDSIHALFEKADTPHFIQMHAGEVDQKQIDRFVAKEKLVKKQQTVAMINVANANLYINHAIPELNSVMEASFVTQNVDFDFLLDANNEPAQVEAGEIGVPIYYVKQKHLKFGDTIKIEYEDFIMELTITSFIKDVQMNPSIISSKRFLIHESDWIKLKKYKGIDEYLIEFQLEDSNQVSEFETIYQNSNLPTENTSLTYDLLWTLNSMTDGIMIAVILLLSILAIIMALLCLRFAILMTMEEEYREMGVMKAIGLSIKDITNLYLVKYAFISFFACLIGYVLSYVTQKIFIADMIAYMGEVNNNWITYILPLLAILIIWVLILTFCKWILRKLKKLSVVEAIRFGQIQQQKKRNRNYISLYHHKIASPIFLGVKNIISKRKSNRILIIICIVSVLLVSIPNQILTTIQDRSFITYMGAGESDIRVDITKSKDMYDKQVQVGEYLRKDRGVKKYTILVTCAFDVPLSNGTHDTIKVEIGDFTKFPLTYIEGTAPIKRNDIAFSMLQAEELDVVVGDEILITANGQNQKVTICGIYQDITNGGKTAKANIEYQPADALWYTINIDILNSNILEDKMQEYSKEFTGTKVTGIHAYLSQTLGSTISQVDRVSNMGIILSILLISLISSMFFKLLLIKDRKQLTIMKSIGISTQQLQRQYSMQMIIVIVIGLGMGIITSRFVGPVILSVFGTVIGASQITPVTNQSIAYITLPSLLLLIATASIIIHSRTIKKHVSIQTLSE